MNSGTPVRRTKRRKSQNDALSRTLGPQIIKLRSEKSSQNDKTCGLGVAWEALGRGLGGILAPGAAQGHIDSPWVPKPPPLGDPIFDMFRDIGCFVESFSFEAPC